MEDSRIKNASELLKSVFGDVEIVQKAGKQYEILRAWERCAGPKLAAHARILDLRDTCLEIEADHPGWIQLLRMREKRIIEGMTSLFPELDIRTISIRIEKQGMQRRVTPETIRSVDAKMVPREEENTPTGPIPEVSPELKALLEKLGKSIRGKGDR